MIGAAAKAKEALARPLARKPRRIALVEVAGDQRRRMGVGAGDDQGFDESDAPWLAAPR